MILPIGNNCATAESLKALSLRKTSYPFDWIVSELETNIEILLKILQMSDTQISVFLKVFFDKNCNRTYIQAYDKNEVFNNIKYNISFPHDKIDTIYEKYLRRFNKVLIIFISRWTSHEIHIYYF